MPRARLDQDIRPLSEFRTHAASLVQQVRETKRPLVLTQRGHSTAVVLDVAEYERLLEQVEILRDIRTAEHQLAEGHGIPHADAKARILARLNR